MSLKLVNYTCFLLFVWILYSCSTVKFIPEGKSILDEVKIESDVSEYKKLKSNFYSIQLPNYKIFGILKSKLYIYNLFGKDSIKWYNRFFQKIGEPPVIFDSSLVYKTESELKKILVNTGYLSANVSSKIFLHDKKVYVIYQIHGNTPFYINSYSISIEDSSIKNELEKELEGENPNLHFSLIKRGMLFNKNLLNDERERITVLLQNRGYFKFSKENIVYTADSISNNIDLELKLNFSDSAIAHSVNKKFYYDSVFFYTNYNELKPDAEYHKKNSIICMVSPKNHVNRYTSNKFYLDTTTLLNNSFIFPKEPYSQLKKELTATSLRTLHLLSRIYIKLDEKRRNDSALLDCHIFTVPAWKQSAFFSIDGTNTSGNFGVASSFNYTHRNLFQKAEIFNFQFRWAYEAVKNFFDPYMELGVGASLHIPKFAFNPIKISPSKYYTSTNISTNYNYLYRPIYKHILWFSAIQLEWRKRLDSTTFHSLNLLRINYFKNDSLLLSNYTDQLIVGTNYSFFNSFSDFLGKNIYKFHFFAESAGNILYLLSLMNNFHTESKLINHSSFARFTKIEMNYSHNKKMNLYNSLVYRIRGGIIVPYGNSDSLMLPLEERYYSGGANSVRAWGSRELGPGSYSLDDSTSYCRSGDIKLDFGIEYRIKFFWKLELATFFDAGNIWIIKKNLRQEDGVFLLNTFFKEIAMGYGLGLRFNFDYLILRFDCAEKVYDPTKTQEERLVLFHPNFRDNFRWHFAVGYPF